MLYHLYLPEKGQSNYDKVAMFSKNFMTVPSELEFEKAMDVTLDKVVNH